MEVNMQARQDLLRTSLVIWYDWYFNTKITKFLAQEHKWRFYYVFLWRFLVNLVLIYFHPDFLTNFVRITICCPSIFPSICSVLSATILIFFTTVPIFALICDPFTSSDLISVTESPVRSWAPLLSLCISSSGCDFPPQGLCFIRRSGLGSTGSRLWFISSGLCIQVQKEQPRSCPLMEMAVVHHGVQWCANGGSMNCHSFGMCWSGRCRLLVRDPSENILLIKSWSRLRTISISSRWGQALLHGARSSMVMPAILNRCSSASSLISST